MINKIIGSYKITKKLGEGGMGTVYLASHVNIGTKVAIKVLHKHLISNNTIRTRFLKEAKMQAILDHPNITKVIDFIDNNDGLFIILEFVEGEELNDYLFKNKGLMPEKEANLYMSKILDAVAYAHSKGIIHRDLKSANIMITPNRNIKIMDFGIAKLAGDSLSLTKTGSRIGSPLYMSPEQVTSGEIDFRSDIYSLGVVYHEMLTGKPVYDQNNTTEYEIYDKIVRQPLPRLKTFYPLISVKAQDIVDRATSKLPLGRFQNCNEFKQALQNDVLPYPSIPNNVRKKSNNGVLKILGVLLLLGLLGSGAWFFVNQDKLKSTKLNLTNDVSKTNDLVVNENYKNALETYQSILKKEPGNIVIKQKIKDLKELSRKYNSNKINQVLFDNLNTNNLDTLSNRDSIFIKNLAKNYKVTLQQLENLKSDNKVLETDFDVITKLKSLKNQLITNKDNNVESVPFDFVEVVPSFKNCRFKNNSSQKRCFNKKIKQYLNNNINKKLYNNLNVVNGKHTIKYTFIVDEKGKIGNIKINAPHDAIEQDINNILNTLNNFKPGKNHDKTVAVTYASSFDIKIGNKPLKNESIKIVKDEEPVVVNVPSSVSFQEAERAPVYPGCEGELDFKVHKCTSRKILNYIQEEVIFDNLKEGKAYKETVGIRFRVTKTGVISNIKIGTQRNQVKQELIRVINTLPKMQPAIFENSLPVAANFSGTYTVKVTLE